MEKPLLILITGQPCTGKSYFLHKLSNDLNLSYLSRDEIKESLFDSLGIGDSEWSKKLGGASYSLLFQSFEKMLKTKRSFIIESNFGSNHIEALKMLLDKYDFYVVEVHLHATPQVLLSRFKARWDSGERHRGHADNERFEEFETRMKDKSRPLNLSNRLIDIDTSDFKAADYEKIKGLLQNPQKATE